MLCSGGGHNRTFPRTLACDPTQRSRRFYQTVTGDVAQVTFSEEPAVCRLIGKKVSADW